MVVQDESENVSRREAGATSDTAKMLLAAAGLIAAFGVASCCALPVALSLVGIGAASLLTIGILAAPYQHVLFYAAVLCVGAASVVLWRQRRARACSPGAACARPAFDVASIAAMVLAVALLALTFWIEPPV
ncbi:MAG: mercuric reductase [Alphaproteobacteria bacterium]|nr:mercuric reductase [Alphaproteobacteria bacterium]